MNEKSYEITEKSANIQPTFIQSQTLSTCQMRLKLEVQRILLRTFFYLISFLLHEGLPSALVLD